MIFNSLLFTLFIILCILVCASLFSFLETATVAISEHKLKLMQDKYRWAKYAYLLKKKLNSVLIFSLFGNSLFNAVFTTISTIIVSELLHGFNSKLALPLTTVFIALFIIIFSDQQLAKYITDDEVTCPLK